MVIPQLEFDNFLRKNIWDIGEHRIQMYVFANKEALLIKLILRTIFLRVDCYINA